MYVFHFIDVKEKFVLKIKSTRKLFLKRNLDAKANTIFAQKGVFVGYIYCRVEVLQ